MQSLVACSMRVRYRNILSDEGTGESKEWQEMDSSKGTMVARKGRQAKRQWGEQAAFTPLHWAKLLLAALLHRMPN